MAGADKTHGLESVSPLLFRNIRNFVLRPGKRVRPIMFAAGYLGFRDKAPAGLYTSALSMELLHDFMLVHDDIIDKSDTRRGKPSMHKMLGNHLKKYRGLKFSGQDLSIIAGDVIYSLAIEAFLAVKEDPARKEKALRRFIQAAVYTGVGEFIELTGEIKSLKDIDIIDINRVYDYKTAYYTFACPLSAGAELAGADQRQVDILGRYGMHLGRAFQIKDDILGMFSEEAEIGKSILTDLQEAKKTLLVWYAFRKGSKTVRLKMKQLFVKDKVTRKDLSSMRGIFIETGALEFAQKEIAKLEASALALLSSSRIRPSYKKQLEKFTDKLLST